MRPLRRIGLRLARIEYVRQAMVDKADLSAFKAKPSLRLLIGVFLIGLSMLLGWPAVGLFGGLALYFQEPMIAIIGGPATYGFSWLVMFAGIWVAGKDALKYANVFNRWSARVGVEKLIGKPPVCLDESNSEGAREGKAEKES